MFSGKLVEILIIINSNFKVGGSIKFQIINSITTFYDVSASNEIIDPILSLLSLFVIPFLIDQNY